MAIIITKCESKKDIIHDEDSILTTLYGKIPVVTSFDSNNYTYFDTIDGYNLFISNDANNTIAVKEELMLDEDIVSKESIDSIIAKLIEQYQLDTNTINWSDTDNAIIIKSEDKDVLNNIYNDYKDNKDYKPEFVTENVLFLNKIDGIKLEDNTDDIIDKLDDASVKDVASKTGVKLSGNETKDQLKGIIKGAIATQNK